MTTEFDIFLPLTKNDGATTEPEIIERIKMSLATAFGGYTHFQHRSEGAWSVGGVTFRDEVTVLRVLDDGNVGFDMNAFKKSLEDILEQKSVLIVAREVRIIG